MAIKIFSFFVICFSFVLANEDLILLNQHLQYTTLQKGKETTTIDWEVVPHLTIRVFNPKMDQIIEEIEGFIDMGSERLPTSIYPAILGMNLKEKRLIYLYSPSFSPSFKQDQRALFNL